MTDFSAQSSALGYFYQVRYALLLLLAAEKDEAELAIEKLDDISFEENGTAYELIQTKHHTQTTASLSNTSTDLWKTLRVWSEHLLQGHSIDNTVLTLITTAAVPTSDLSVTRQLKPGIGRNNKNVSDELLKIASTSASVELQPAFAAYKQLTDAQREKLVAAIQILDKSPDIVDTADQIKRKLQVRIEHREAAYNRIEGWWFERVVGHLNSGSIGSIKKMDLLYKIVDVAEQLHPDALPIDYASSDPPNPPDPLQDERRFVDQLRVIALQNKQISNAIRDFYRAFEQRSRWEREQLLNPDELKTYERRLVDEWERQALWNQYSESDETDMQRCGRDLFKWAEQADFPIRPRVTEPYVMRGSFHMLANENLPRIWWHPKFVDRLKELVDIPEPPSHWENQPVEVQNLFNPAFCAQLLDEAIKGYCEEKPEGMPFGLLFLILPVLLHKETRAKLPRSISTKLHVWLSENGELRIGFAQRTRQLIAVTKQSLHFAIDRGHIRLSESDYIISTNKAYRRKSKTEQSIPETSEIKEIRKRAAFVGRWYALTGNMSAIYVIWGVRP